MKTFAYDDIEIRYRIEGSSGPVIILLHGFGGGPSDWSEIMPTLTQKYRVVAPNLKTFFSRRVPITFSNQVRCLKKFVETVLNENSAQVVNFIGQSYGATLSLGIRLTSEFNVDMHIMANAMPFHPFERVQNQHVQMLLNFGTMPGGINLYFKTEQGRRSLEELAKIFRIGALGEHEVKHFNSRKLMLVEKAFERFLWIDKNENWSIWRQKLDGLKEGVITRFLFAGDDPLFTKDNYLILAREVKAKSIAGMPGQGHILKGDWFSYA